VRRNERGIALIFVLYLLIALGVLVAEVAQGVRAEAAGVAAIRARSVGRYAAESGIVIGVVRIHQVMDSASTVVDRVNGFRDLDADLARTGDNSLGLAKFRVTVINLNARIDLNRASEPVLAEFFRQFTGREGMEATLTGLKEEPLRRVGELARLPGMDQSLAFAVAPYVTVWGDGLVDINAAPESVLAALPEIGQDAAADLVRRRESGEVFTSADPFHTAAGRPAGNPDQAEAGQRAVPIPNVVTLPTRLLLVSRGWQEGHPLTHEIQAVYSILGQKLVLLSWWERDL
jgi:type II secretory pathway component PulK